MTDLTLFMIANTTAWIKQCGNLAMGPNAKLESLKNHIQGICDGRELVG